MSVANYSQGTRIFRACNRIYEKYHHSRFISPDPLEIPRQFLLAKDQEVVALISSVFALGRVDLILDTLNRIFSRFPHPSTQLVQKSAEEIEESLGGLKYRFFSPSVVVLILKSVAELQSTHGTLEKIYAQGGLGLLQRLLVQQSGGKVPGITFPNPQGIAKRLHLFLRWVVRDDAIDLGLWDSCYKPRLVYPLDTHIFHTSVLLGITDRTRPDLRAQQEISEFFRLFCPEDPVRYDFSLSRIGLGKDLSDYEYKIAVLRFFD